jgi:ABC-2 type transport system permease protein
LLGAANPFQLMSGKLLGSVASSLTTVSIYLAGGYFLARHYEYDDLLPLRILPLFLLFQVLAVVLISSIFLAIGAAANSLKEAQGLLVPVWLILLVPMFTWFNVVREPNGPFARGLSLFPPATPLVMTLRLTASGSVPVWECALGIFLVLVTTLFCVYAAARIFRIGMLAQGNTPTFTQLLRWAFAG